MAHASSPAARGNRCALGKSLLPGLDPRKIGAVLCIRGRWFISRRRSCGDGQLSVAPAASPHPTKQCGTPQRLPHRSMKRPVPNPVNSRRTLGAAADEPASAKHVNHPTATDQRRGAQPALRALRHSRSVSYATCNPRELSHSKSRALPSGQSRPSNQRQLLPARGRADAQARSAHRPIAQLAIYTLALTRRVPGLKLFDIRCAWFNEHEYCEISLL